MMADFVFPALISGFIADTPNVLMWITAACAVTMLALFAAVSLVVRFKRSSIVYS